MCKVLKGSSLEKTCPSSLVQCCGSGKPTHSFKQDSDEIDSIHVETGYTDIVTRKKVIDLPELVYT